VIVSTGAGLAVPFFVLGWLIRIPTVYIEVFDRVDSRTLTGRLCRPFTSLFLVQWEEQRVLYRDAVVAGELLWCGDGREPEPGPAGQVSGPSPAPGTQAPLLLVTVGTDHHPFTRLITWVEDWLADGGDQRVRVLIQHGDTPVAAADGRIGQLDFDELQAALRSASIVITHAGATVMEARNAGRLPIVVPRRAELGEHVDGHQVRFCQWLDAKGLAVICDTEDKLRAALDRAVAAATAGTGLAAGLPAAGQVPSSSGTRDLVPAGPRRAGELIDTLLARRSPGKARKPTRAGRPVDG
jgi:UDP-N-acetylglucosamine transferase subunit ALG13